MNIWRERLHRWLAPMAARCPFAPNTITIAALMMNAAAATGFYFALGHPALFLISMPVVAIAGFADALDGIVARVQHKESRYGDFLDHFADRVSDILLITGWLLGNRVRVEITVIVIIAVMLNGYLGTQIEASWKSRSYDSVGRGEFVLALIIFPIASFILATNGWAEIRPGRFLIAEWMSLMLLLVAIAGIAQRLATASRMERS
jgi:phosphatidylglycerophosphate synthase